MPDALESVLRHLPFDQPKPFVHVARQAGMNEGEARRALMTLQSASLADVVYGRGWYRKVPCAYCGRPTAFERRACEPWDWPGRGKVTNCLDCSGETGVQTI